MPHPALAALPCCHGDVGRWHRGRTLGSHLTAWEAEDEAASIFQNIAKLPCFEEELRQLTTELERLRPLAAELERLRPLASKVDVLWQHHQRGLAVQELAPPALADELQRMQLEQLEQGRRLSEGQQALGALESAQEQLREALAAATEARTALEEQVRGLGGRVAELGVQSLELGPPIGRSLNSLDWAALHCQTRHDLEECRREIQQLWLKLGREGTTAGEMHEAVDTHEEPPPMHKWPQGPLWGMPR